LEKNLLIIIPVYNEFDNIKKVYFNLKKKKYKVLFINDCSTDDTEKFLKENKILFLKNKKQLGYEKTLLKGFNYAINKNFKFILSMDSDGEHNVNDIKKFINHYKKKRSDIIIGSRDFKPRFMENIISSYFKFRYNINDPFSGFVLYKTEIFKNIKILNYNDSYLVDLLKILILKKKKYSEIFTKVKKRKDKPRVGNNFFVNMKMVRIFISILF
jgi:hypothetical protein